MPLNFDKNAEKGKLFLSKVAYELGDMEDTDRAGRIMKCVFKTLRKYLTLEENFQLLAQLPTAIKGVYVEDWSPFKEKNNGRKKSDFISELIKYDGKSSWRDFSSLEDGEKAAQAVFRVLRNQISEGEINDIMAVLNKHIKNIFLEEKIE